MNEVVIDASVAVKWLVQEEYSQEARRLLSADALSRLKLIAPDVLIAEIGHALQRSSLQTDGSTKNRFHSSKVRGLSGWET